MLLLGGWAYEREDCNAVPETRRALDSLIDLGLGLRRAATGERLFDPVEVTNHLKSAGLAGHNSFWADRYVRTGRRLVTDLAGRRAGNIEVDFRRTFNASTIAMGKSVRLRAPLPLRSVYGDSLQIHPFVEGASGAQLSMTDGRLEARLTAVEGDLTLGARLKFACEKELSHDFSAADNSIYLKPREGLIVISDAVRALAASLASSQASPDSALRAFWHYMIDELACGAVHYDQIRADAPCDTVLDMGWYDCQLGSALFVALCRSHGIPARIASGHLLYRRAPTNHYWAEVWLDDQGWLPFDFLSWDLSLGGSDLQWRDHFYGRVDDRMVTQLLPLKFTGALGLALPNAWHILQAAKDDGVTISLMPLTGGRIYSDFISVSN